MQQEYAEYRYTHEIVKTNLDYITMHDSFSKILQQELFSVSNPLTQALSNNNLNTSELEGRTNIHQLFTQFMNNSEDIKFGLTPLVKKFKLIKYTLQSSHEKHVLSQNVSPNISEIKKEPLKDFANIYAELENFVAKISTNFSHEVSNIVHPHTSFISTIEKIAKTNQKILPFDPTGKSVTQPDVEESSTVRKRLSLIDVDNSKLNDESVEKEREQEKEMEKDKEPKSPQLSSRSNPDIVKTPPTLTPVKSVTYKVPAKESTTFTTNISSFSSGALEELSYQTQLISVHHNLSVGDLISVSGVPYRIVHKEWIFPEDIVQMVNIFTGERIEVKYNSRYTGMEDQVMTKKYQVIQVSSKKGYYLLMDMAWDKTDTFKRLPKVIETKDVLDKRLEEDIKEAFYSDKKAIVHVLRVKDKEIIVSYRKEWL